MNLTTEQKKDLVKLLVAGVALVAKSLGVNEEEKSETKSAPVPKAAKALPAATTKKAKPAPPEDEDDIGDVEEDDIGDVEETATPEQIREELVRIAKLKGKTVAYAKLAEHGGGAAKVADVAKDLLGNVYSELKKIK